MIYLLVIVGAVLVGVAIFRHMLKDAYNAASTAPEPGWVYFISAIGGDEEEPPAPIKVGMTHRNPLTERLPELSTMSPKPLEVLYAFATERPTLMERLVHEELADYRLHGEWFERDAVLMFIEYLKGAA